MRKRQGRNAMLLLLPVLAVVILIGFASALSNLKQGQSDESKQQLEAALHRGAVACYAAEGIYPPNVEYLQEHYGIQIDESRYTVVYEVFASNIMPEITVLEN